MALIARRAGDQVSRPLADRVDVVVALGTSARHHVGVREMGPLERVGRVAAVTRLRRGNVVGRHEHGCQRVALNVAGRTRPRGSSEDSA